MDPTLREGLFWDGVAAHIVLYGWFPGAPAGTPVETDAGTPLDSPVGTVLDARVGETVPLRPVKGFPLEDPDRILSDGTLVVHDIRYPDLPEDPRPLLTRLLARVHEAGASLAWCAFEGGFDFTRVLAEEDARTVYAVAVRDETPGFALDEATRHATSWRLRLLDLRETFLTRDPT